MLELDVDGFWLSVGLENVLTKSLRLSLALFEHDPDDVSIVESLKG